jgi:hypothetical protein
MGDISKQRIERLVSNEISNSYFTEKGKQTNKGDMRPIRL